VARRQWPVIIKREASSQCGENDQQPENGERGGSNERTRRQKGEMLQRLNSLPEGKRS
jgi:hypothetical protein